GGPDQSGSRRMDAPPTPYGTAVPHPLWKSMSRIRNLRLGVRLGLAFGLVCLACALVGTVGITGAGGMSDDVDTLTDGAHSLELLSIVKESVALDTSETTRHLYVYDGDLE